MERRRTSPRASRLITAALPRGAIGPYQLQAAIAAVHDEAPSAEETDWPQIAALYEVLLRISDNPVVALNHAVAVAMVRRPAGRAATARPSWPTTSGSPRITGCTRCAAHLLELAGDHAGAARARIGAAAERTMSLPQQRYLHDRAARLERAGGRRVQSMSEADTERISERADLLPEELAAGSDNPEAQAEAILADSDRRTDQPEQTRDESPPDPQLMADLIRAEFEVLDERFCGTGGDRWLERAFTGGRWLEGPAYSPAGRFVLFSDIPNDRVLRYDEISGRIDVFTQPAGFTNGRTVDRQGRFVTCEHGARRVTRGEHDGSIARAGGRATRATG